MPGCQFASDNTAGACPEALDALIEANAGSQASYGNDRYTSVVADRLRELFAADCEVFFVFNGTAANSLAVSTCCQPYHSVICADVAHLETDECGGPEFFSGGAKLLLAEFIARQARRCVGGGVGHAPHRYPLSQAACAERHPVDGDGHGLLARPNSTN